MKKINIGIVGLGHVSFYQMEALNKLKDKFKLTSICDIDPSREVFSNNNTVFYTDHLQLIEKENIDALLISVSNANHFSVANSSIGKVNNILLEKPATLDLKSLDSLYKLSLKNGSLLHVAFHASFAKDLVWYLENSQNNKIINNLGRITGFNCNFFDPYIKDGKLLCSAKSLNGSWLDSGVNALSVLLSIFQEVSFDYSHTTKLSLFPCDDISSFSRYTAKCSDGYFASGTINTNWALNLNRKITELFYENSSAKIVLNHTDQKVVFHDFRSNKEIVLADFSSNGERLTNHYLGVFNDFYNTVITNESNMDFSVKVHEALFSRYE